MHRWYSGRDFVRVESCRGGWWTLTTTPASSRSPPPSRARSIPSLPGRPTRLGALVHRPPPFIRSQGAGRDTAATSGPAVRNRPRRVGSGALVVGMLKWKDDRTKKTDGKKSQACEGADAGEGTTATRPANPDRPCPPWPLERSGSGSRPPSMSPIPSHPTLAPRPCAVCWSTARRCCGEPKSFTVREPIGIPVPWASPEHK